MTQTQMWISNELLIRTVTFSGLIEAKEPLRIGSGKTESLTSTSDLPVLKFRIGDLEVPVIPGSSWKGIFRSRLESYLRTHGKKVCGGPGNTCMDRRELKDKIEYLLRKPNEENRRAAIEILSKELCMACKIFGSPSYISKVYFSDSYPIKEEGIYYFSLGRKPGIAIDRRTGAVRRGALYDVEFVEPGSKFTFNLTARNLPNYALGLLAKIIVDLNNGVLRIGGFKTRGFGRISFIKVDHSISGASYDNDKVFKGFTDKKRLWFDKEDLDVEYDGTTWNLVINLVSLADKWLGQGEK